MKWYKGGLQNCYLSLRGLNGAQNEAVPWISPVCHYFLTALLLTVQHGFHSATRLFFISVLSLSPFFFFFFFFLNAVLIFSGDANSTTFVAHWPCFLFFFICLFRIKHQRKKTNLTNNLHCSSESFLGLPPLPLANNKERNLYLMYLWKREMS